MSFVRAASLIIVLVVCAWFALGIRQATSLTAAETLVDAQTHATAAQARRVQSLLDEAAMLNPDREVDILRARILLERGQDRPALGIIEGVTRAEPQNIEAWLWLAHASPSNPRRFYYALRRVGQLEPLLP